MLMQSIIIESGHGICGPAPAPDRGWTADQILDVRDVANTAARWLELPNLHDRAVVLIIAVAVTDGAIDRRQTWPRILETLQREAAGKSNSLPVSKLKRACAVELATYTSPTQMVEILDRDYPLELLRPPVRPREAADKPP
jgi:hypothetical protein